MKKLKFLVVCNLGIGTSVFLKILLKEVLVEKGISGIVENTDVATAPTIKCDAIFTSRKIGERLAGRVSVPIYIVENLADNKELATGIEEFLSL